MKSILMAFAVTIASVFAQDINVIPKPAEIVKGNGTFQLNADTEIVVSDGAEKTAKQLQDYLKPATGFTVSTKGTGNFFINLFSSSDNTISLVLDDESKLGAEAYKLESTSDQIVITAKTETGLFYGCQTLRQLLPVEIFSNEIHKNVKWTVPAVTIKDQPRFGWRGMMIDSSRHFQTVDYLKKFIDRLAMQKLNKFHWHIVDGHGWRLEIKKYPRLTDIGAWRPQPPIGRYGGFYTQEEVKEIVKYAADRHITVIPEIEMPGHSMAAIASYPELSCSKVEGTVAPFYEYPCAAQRFPHCKNSDVFCASNEKVFTFLEDVLKETFELFPSTYIHVGGDEVNKGDWKRCPSCQKFKKEQGLKDEHELQSYFMKRMEKFINKNGRRMIGWDEILEGGLAPNATVMSWRGIKGGIKSAKMGHDVVMSPEKPLYFDHGQSRHPSHPAHWPGIETLKEVYHYNPIPKELTAEEAKHILGAQANLWSVFIHTPELHDVQTYPRQFALAETVWTPLENKNWDDYLKRQAVSLKRLDQMNISYWIEPDMEKVAKWQPSMCKETNQEWTFDLTGKVKKSGRINFVFQYTRGGHRLDIEKAELLKNGQPVSSDEHDGFSGGSNHKNTYTLELKSFDPTAKYELKARVHSDGGTDSYGEISLTTADGIDWYKAPKLSNSSATKATTQNRDKKMYDWKERHNRCKKFVKKNSPDVIFIGDSITHYWGGEPSNRYKCAPKVWNKYFGNLNTANLGFGWDRTENVLWRLKNGALAETKPKLVVMMIGTNNLDINTDKEIADGIKAICDEINTQSPNTKILLVGILPRLKQYKTNPEDVNLLTSFLHNRNNVTYFNANYGFTDKDGKIKKELFRDEVHPNAKGYEVIGSTLKPVIEKLLK